MTLIYTLTEEDYLQSQLFMASKSERIKKQRKKKWLWLSVASIICLFLFHDENDKFWFYYFVTLAVLCTFFYPFYSAYIYKRHFKKHVADVHKNSFNENSRITFTGDTIKTEDRTGTSKIFLTELENVSETGVYFYLKLKTGLYIIIPKAQLNNVDDVRSELQSLSKKLNINFISDLNWKWK